MEFARQKEKRETRNSWTLTVMGLAVVLMMVSILLGGRQTSALGVVQNVHQTKATGRYVEIAWDRLGNGYKYEVYTSVNNKTFTKNSAVASVSTNATITGLTSGTSYFVKVRAVSTKGVAVAESKVIEVTTAPAEIDQTSVTQTAATDHSVTLSWTPVMGTTGYEIYRNDVLVATTMDATVEIQGVSCDESVGKIYIYPVRNIPGYQTKASYAYYLSAKAQPRKMAKPKATNFYPNSKAVYVSTAMQKEADGIDYVLQYEKKSKKKTKTVTKTGTQRTKVIGLKKMKQGTFYRIKVRSYTTVNGVNIYGEWSDYTYFAQPLVLKNKRLGRSATFKISWKKVTGAKNYTVYMSEKEKGKFKKIATTKKTSQVVKKYKKKGLKLRKKYYVYVVANKKVGKKTVHSKAKYTYYIYMYNI